jgi:hypothetical protein
VNCRILNSLGGFSELGVDNYNSFAGIMLDTADHLLGNTALLVFPFYINGQLDTELRGSCAYAEDHRSS